MRIAVAADHAGFPLKSTIVDDLRRWGHEAVDLGTHDGDVSTDYPDHAAQACEAVRSRQAERGIVICGSGIGACIASNKFPGIRAGICHDTYSAHQGVEHDDMNVLCIGSRIIGREPAREIVRAFVEARFVEDERFVRRLKKVLAIEARYTRDTSHG
jgi:ribose 5-phosphate isomerase B